MSLHLAVILLGIMVIILAALGAAMNFEIRTLQIEVEELKKK